MIIRISKKQMSKNNKEEVQIDVNKELIKKRQEAFNEEFIALQNKYEFAVVAELEYGRNNITAVLKLANLNNLKKNEKRNS